MKFFPHSAIFIVMSLFSAVHAEGIPAPFSVQAAMHNMPLFSERQASANAIPVMQPLEFTLGRLFLSGGMDITEQTNAGNGNDAPAYLRMDHPFQNFGQYRTPAAPELQYRKQVLLMEENRPVQQTFSAGFHLGYGLGNPALLPVNLMLGFTSQYHQMDPFSRTLATSEENAFAQEYGTVFFTPGLQLASRSLLFQAFIEVPVHQIGNGNDFERNPERMRANIGVQYNFQ